MGATVNFYGLIARASLSIEAKIKDPTEKKHGGKVMYIVQTGRG